ncbi:extracellular serine/threonine protein kinase FAM20C-like [Seriola lalandi dorsalis]|uniref:extracellular serine/threonine protein kinase FAM20C-like n=1 Tax=Seriola lalandi dorsalis TaxID=1841481 RepID=UPI000C6FBF60|nr:extracellular serine/threonine protein kinase FAM20C-like [Seriola lalandi dorsalis]
MMRQNLGRSTRSIYLALACLSLTLHLLLAFFCLSVLQTACVLPASSSSSSSSMPRTDTQHHRSVSHSSSSSDASSSSSQKLPTSPQNDEHHKLNASTLHLKGKDDFSAASEREKKLIGTGQVIQKVKGRSKLEALFDHPLYNLPHPELREDDWLLRVKTNEDASDTESEEEQKEDDISNDSEWQSASQEEGYDRVAWTSDVETHPPWLRFHLGISRWELYNRKDPNLAQLTHYLATQRIHSAVQKTGGTQLKLLISFPNYGQALLKPMKQPRDAETDLNLFYFSDFERHNAEIAAFHLDRSWRSPWRRSYSRTKLAQWVHCNMDRHHYETFEKFGNETFLLHLDNGRAFGRHSRDEPSILAPLQQCCRIHRSTLLRLRLLSLPGFRLSDVMRESLARDPLAGAVAPFLSEPHLSALDRRLAAVLQVVRTCQDQHGDVIHNDLEGYDEEHHPQPD